MPKEKKNKESTVWPDSINLGSYSFIQEVAKLISCGLWEETPHQVKHRFGDKSFISYSRPKPEVKFSLAGKMWRKKAEDDIPF